MIQQSIKDREHDSITIGDGDVIITDSMAYIVLDPRGVEAYVLIELGDGDDTPDIVYCQVRRVTFGKELPIQLFPNREHRTVGPVQRVIHSHDYVLELREGNH